MPKLFRTKLRILQRKLRKIQFYRKITQKECYQSETNSLISLDLGLNNKIHLSTYLGQVLNYKPMTYSVLLLNDLCQCLNQPQIRS